MDFLNKNDIIEVDDDYFEPFDTILFEQMKLLCDGGLFDQLHEAVSIGRYFLKRNNKEALEYLLNSLNGKKITTDNEIKWASVNYNKNLNYKYKFDFGLAHGMAGILYFVSCCYKQGIKPVLCMELINGINKFYNNNQQDFEKCGSFYPAFISTDEYVSSHKELQTRTAWCYGDPGVLYSIFLSALYTGEKELMKSTLEKLEKVAVYRDMLKTIIHDAGFCHGSASLAQIFNRLYYFTGNSLFKQTAVYWLKVTMIMGRNTSVSPTGYMFYIQQKWQFSYELLEGIAGVGLVLLSSLKYNNIDWDEAMMLV